MSLNQVTAIPYAVHAMKPTENKESTPKELDTSALLEISVLLKILSSMNSPTLKKPLLEKPTNTLIAFLATKDQKILEISVLTVLAHAQPQPEVSVLEPQEQSDRDVYHLTL